MTILQVCAYGAEYPGNFIASLEALEHRLADRGINTIYAFVGKAKEKKWCKEIQKRTKVYFLPEAKARILPITYKIFHQIYKENAIDIVHSHFELYDIPATIMASKNIRVFWHLHDPILPGKGLRGVLWKIQYRYIGKKAYLLAVSDFYREAAIKMGFPANQSSVVLNCINLKRISDCSKATSASYDFLTFGWDFYRKGDDLILDACEQLEKDGYSFKILLNGNKNTWLELERYLQGRIPSYLVKGQPVDDVNTLFCDSRVFIQASRRETFSYAVCEAAYAGLPVICSEISGLEWAHDLPTVTFFDLDSKSLYSAMREFLSGNMVDKKAVNNTQQIIEERYSIDVWVKAILKAYGIKEMCE